MTDRPEARPIRQAALLCVAVWALACICYLTPTAAAGQVSGRYLLFLAICAVTGLTLSAGLSVVIIGAQGMARIPRLALYAASVLAATLLHAGLDTAVFIAMYRPHLVNEAGAYLGPRGMMFLLNILMLGAVYVIYAVALALTLSSRALAVRDSRLAAALAAAQDAQLAALRLQINPHFLFNALNAVTALIGAGRDAEAQRVVGRLADFFRASLDAPAGAMTTLEEEFDVVGSYLQIEAARFGERLQVEIDLPSELAEALAPHFLLQPLAENAVKHGVARTRLPVRLSISASADGGVLTLAVRDDARVAEAQAPAAGPGVGLANVRARLAALFGDQGDLRLTPLDPGYLAQVRLPLAYAATHLKAAE